MSTFINRSGIGYYAGGAYGSTELWSIDLKSGNWTKLPDMGTAAERAICVVLNDIFYVIGGEVSQYPSHTG